jgi:RNA recognition motif-containing protein
MTNIFVGNLSFGATEETLRSMFENFGPVERASIVTDRDTGRSRGFGFVEMTNAEEGGRAIAALNGSDCGGRALTVNEARPKADRGSSFGGGAYRANSGSYRGDRDHGRTSRW